jgi:hypothetical protein
MPGLDKAFILVVTVNPFLVVIPAPGRLEPDVMLPDEIVDADRLMKQLQGKIPQGVHAPVERGLSAGVRPTTVRSRDMVSF